MTVSTAIMVTLKVAPHLINLIDDLGNRDGITIQERKEIRASTDDSHNRTQAAMDKIIERSEQEGATD